MKSYAVILAAAVLQGAAAQEASPVHDGRPLAPPRGGRLPADHVVKLNLPTALHESACFQNSTGQRRDENPDELIKYPCNSEQEIIAYCDSKYKNDIEGMKLCLFNEDSSYERDHICCIACRNLNGDGTEGSEESAVKYMEDLKQQFVLNNTDNRDFTTVSNALRKNIPKAHPNNTAVVINGVADINILSYCPNPKLPQHAGSPKKTDDKPEAPQQTGSPKSTTQGAVPEKTLEPTPEKAPETEAKFVDMPLSQTYTARFNYGSDVDSKNNKSGSVGEEAYIQMQRDYKFKVCVTCAAPGLSKEVRVKMHLAAQKASEISLVREMPLYDTVQKKSEAESKMDTKDVVVYDANQCGCFQPPQDWDFKPSSPKALGSGVKINIDMRFFGEGDHQAIDSTAGQNTANKETRPGQSGASASDRDEASPRMGGNEEEDDEDLYC
ncbi:hypothetical protein CDD83_2645 [Cordyceps sp. RAO-2017]|nr:hypothetical protein CDD83_2645 [Cordyceps sp. RAO-2017]